MIERFDGGWSVNPLYLCNGKRCEHCWEECVHATDIRYALNKEYIMERLIKDVETLVNMGYLAEVNGKEETE